MSGRLFGVVAGLCVSGVVLGSAQTPPRTIPDPKAVIPALWEALGGKAIRARSTPLRGAEILAERAAAAA